MDTLPAAGFQKTPLMPAFLTNASCTVRFTALLPASRDKTGWPPAHASLGTVLNHWVSVYKSRGGPKPYLTLSLSINYLRQMVVIAPNLLKLLDWELYLCGHNSDHRNCHHYSRAFNHWFSIVLFVDQQPVRHLEGRNTRASFRNKKQSSTGTLYLRQILLHSGLDGTDLISRACSRYPGNIVHPNTKN